MFCHSHQTQFPCVMPNAIDAYQLGANCIVCLYVIQTIDGTLFGHVRCCRFTQFHRCAPFTPLTKIIFAFPISSGRRSLRFLKASFGKFDIFPKKKKNTAPSFCFCPKCRRRRLSAEENTSITPSTKCIEMKKRPLKFFQ